jgi:hypothetical protein
MDQSMENLARVILAEIKSVYSTVRSTLPLVLALNFNKTLPTSSDNFVLVLIAVAFAFIMGLVAAKIKFAIENMEDNNSIGVLIIINDLFNLVKMTSYQILAVNVGDLISVASNKQSPVMGGIVTTAILIFTQLLARTAHLDTPRE